MMDRDYIIEHQVIERYLQNRLSKEDQAAFEEAYLASPDLLDELETAERLQEGLRDLSLIERSSPAGRRRSWLGSVFHSPQYAMAASVLLLVSVGMTAQLYRQLDQPAEPFSTQITPLVTTRGAPGAGDTNVIELQNPGQNFVLMVDPGFTRYSHFRTTVLRYADDGRLDPIWQANELTPGYEGMLAIGVPGGRLTEGQYAVRVEGWQDAWPPERAYDEVSLVPFTVSLVR